MLHSGPLKSNHLQPRGRTSRGFFFRPYIDLQEVFENRETTLDLFHNQFLHRVKSRFRLRRPLRGIGQRYGTEKGIKGRPDYHT